LPSLELTHVPFGPPWYTQPHHSKLNNVTVAK